MTKYEHKQVQTVERANQIVRSTILYTEQWQKHFLTSSPARYREVRRNSLLSSTSQLKLHVQFIRIQIRKSEKEAKTLQVNIHRACVCVFKFMCGCGCKKRRREREREIHKDISFTMCAENEIDKLLVFIIIIGVMDSHSYCLSFGHLLWWTGGNKIINERQ